MTTYGGNQIRISGAMAATHCVMGHRLSQTTNIVYHLRTIMQQSITYPCRTPLYRIGIIWLVSTTLTRFNPHTHSGRELLVLHNESALYNFNPRAHAGRDVIRCDKSRLHSQFQSTRPRRARHTLQLRQSMACQFQSTRPCRARLVFRLGKQLQTGVSIHAPTRGATIPVLLVH